MGAADNPEELLNHHLSRVIKWYVLGKITCACNRDNPLFTDECSVAFDLK